MRIVHHFRRRAWIFLMAMMLVAALTVTSMASSDKNTDTDVDPIDGYYTFTGNGDWYGYNSYLYNDHDVHTVSAREYEVTLPEDGRLLVELSTTDPDVFIDVSFMTKDYRAVTGDPEWMFGSPTKPISVKKKSDILKKGTHNILFSYNITTADWQQWPPGYHEFYHKLTFVALTADEKAAISVVNAIDALPYSSELTLSNENAVKSAKSSYDALTAAQKAFIQPDYTNKLSSCVTQMTTLRSNANAAAAYNKKVTAAKAVKVKGVKVSALKGRKVRVRWSKATGVSGYQIQYSRSKSFKSGVKKKKITKASTLKATVKSLKAGKTWYFRVRSYTKITNPSGKKVTKYGKWSAVKKCKAKK